MTSLLAQASPAPATAPTPGLLDALFNPSAPHHSPGIPEILFAILFSFGLNSLIAAIYKRTYRGARYSQDYVHTLLILGTVVTMVIMVVHGNSATAFGMFAAFSIIRFRRSVSQSRDIGFIFLAMATGLAVGAQQYLLAAITVPLVCAIIWAISARDLFVAQRSSHLLRIRVNNDCNYDQAFAEVFARYLSEHELTSVETIQAGMMTEVAYEITLRDVRQLNGFVTSLQMVNGNNRVIVTRTADQGESDAD
ncbi:MAG: hypothetical protein RL250_1648 [Verrucomicrobiota bacterium]|jgi:hypothetical protein